MVHPGAGRAANCPKAVRVPGHMTLGRKVTFVLQPRKQGQFLLISRNGRESGLDLSKQKVFQKSFLCGITVHGVILYSQQISPSDVLLR